MKVLRGDPGAWSPPEAGAAVTVGVYDGVHLGHQRVIGELVAAAGESGLSVGAVTFDVHPLSVVAPDRAPGLLTGLDRRLELLEDLGLEFVGVLPFAEGGIRDLSPEEFVDRVLVEGLGVRLVVVGEDFRFGRGRAGDVAALSRLGAERGFGVEVIPLVEEEDRPVSSSTIRELVASGRMEQAARSLGRWFEVRGRVVEGDGRGREIGVPTANLDVASDLVLPARGVYAGYARLPRGEVPAAVNVGIRPMFPTEEDLVEAHLINFEGDLYGRTLTIGFLRRLREERDYETLDELVAQIRRDIDDTLQVTTGIM